MNLILVSNEMLEDRRVEILSLFRLPVNFLVSVQFDCCLLYAIRCR